MHADMVWLILHKFNTMGIKENLTQHTLNINISQDKFFCTLKLREIGINSLNQQVIV